MTAQKDTVKVELEIPKDQLKAKPEVEELLSYKPSELLKAPFEPPEAESSPPVYGQVRNLVVGFTLTVISLLAWPVFGWPVAIAVALVGATMIAVGTLVRV